MKQIHLIIFALLVALCLLGLSLVVRGYLPAAVSFVLESRAEIAGWTDRHYLLSITIFLGAYLLGTIWVLPISSVLNLFAGMFFEPLVAILLALAAAMISATVAFFATRYLFGIRLQRTYADRFKRFNSLIAHYGTYYLLVVRLIPIIPFALINVLAGLTTVRFKTFIVTTFLGAIPMTLLLVFSGRELQHAATMADIFSDRMVFMGIILIVLLFLPILAKKSRLVV
ncbi:MAG: VTT domain-containing protein [Candidatus Dependentiae bacterium]|nr:VTT domain-containing protein [Candidatus Dependentiae bacterium]